MQQPNPAGYGKNKKTFWMNESCCRGCQNNEIPACHQRRIKGVFLH